MDPARTDVLLALTDAATLWRLQPTPDHARSVVDAAVDALVRDVDSPTLRELAGADPRWSSFELEPLVEETLTELGATEHLEHDRETAALRVWCRRLLAGQVPAREVTHWAHRTIGHEGLVELQSFVDLDDLYDQEEYDDRPLDELDQWVEREAASLLAGEALRLYTDSPWAKHYAFRFEQNPSRRPWWRRLGRRR